MKHVVFSLVLAAAGLRAQSAVAPAEVGLESPEEARTIVSAILKEDERLVTILSKIDPQAWYEKKGAPSTYVVQWQSAKQQSTDLTTVGRLFLQHVDHLQEAMDFYFRLESLETTARSLNEGARSYADRPTADQLTAFVAHNFDSRQRFRDYLKDLANSVEQNYKIADGEAQRCRALMSSGAGSPCNSGTASRKRGKS